MIYDADKPISNSEQDKLNRAPFATSLARCLLDHQSPESFVVGLYGGFGSGKTSIVNMTIEELNTASDHLLDDERPIILNFSPWSYSGQQPLVYHFFRRLTSALNDAAFLEDKERIIHLMELYISYFTQTPTQKTSIKKSGWKSWFKSNKKMAWESGRDLTKVKAELNELLHLKKHKIVIVIDNISRLYPEEMKEMFQIIKSIGDFNHTVYLLSFDKHHVLSALSKMMEHGEELVEKIVQLSFDIPPITQQDLENILSYRLNFLLTAMPAGAWQKDRWSDIYYSALKYFFKNCRDITRFVNRLNFSYFRVRDIVNPVDYFALTTLEVFMPHIYEGIRDNKDLFSDLLDEVYLEDSEKVAREKTRCDEILSRSNKHVDNESVLALLFSLFPRIRKLYQPNVVFYHSEIKAQSAHRLCSPDYFNAYFTLSLQQGQIPEVEFQSILSLASNQKEFNQAITRLNKDGKALKFIDQFDLHTLSKLSIKYYYAIIHALLDNADTFEAGLETPLCLDTNTKIYRIIHTLLSKLPLPHDRFSLLKKAIEETTNSIYISVFILRLENRQADENDDTFMPENYRLLSFTELRSLQRIVADKIEHWGKSEKLMTHPQSIELLRAWIEWGDADVARTYIKKTLVDDKKFVLFLTKILDEPICHAMTHYEKNREWKRYLNDIEYFSEIELLANHAKLLFENDYFEKLRENEQLAIMIFLDLVQVVSVKIIPKTSA